ncbi:MAG: glycosyltransferase [Gammaproteobacteria bacterium]|nr:glycosyltransferase [Gammaproteobacteria bacterium]
MESTSNDTVELSVIIPISEHSDPVKELYFEYKAGIEATGKSYEIIYVIDGAHTRAAEELNTLSKTEKINTVTLATKFGEATALSTAFDQSSGNLLLTLPAYRQIDANDIPKLVSKLDDCDMVLARRHPRKDSLINRVQSKIFNYLLGYTSDLKLNDAGCSARAFIRKIANEVIIYGDLHRFFAVLAHREGFCVAEVNVAQSSHNMQSRVYSPGVYVRRALDLLTVFFLIKFTKKPLRFFGLVGLGLSFTGFIITLYLIIERLFFDVTLADRPALFLSSLMIVLGIQVIAIGLIGEIIIFTHARRIKEYTIDKIIN